MEKLSEIIESMKKIKAIANYVRGENDFVDAEVSQLMDCIAVHCVCNIKDLQTLICAK